MFESERVHWLLERTMPVCPFDDEIVPVRLVLELGIVEAELVELVGLEEVIVVRFIFLSLELVFGAALRIVPHFGVWRRDWSRGLVADGRRVAVPGVPRPLDMGSKLIWTCCQQSVACGTHNASTLGELGRQTAQNVYSLISSGTWRQQIKTVFGSQVLCRRILFSSTDDVHPPRVLPVKALMWTGFSTDMMAWMYEW